MHRLTALPGGLALRPAPAGLPDVSLRPPTVAESGDPFATCRVIDLVARLERGRPIRLDDIVAALNARYLDWLFDAARSSPTRSSGSRRTGWPTTATRRAS